MNNAARIDALSQAADLAMYSGDRDAYALAEVTLRGMLDLDVRCPIEADRIEAILANMVESLREPSLWA